MKKNFKCIEYVGTQIVKSLELTLGATGELDKTGVTTNMDLLTLCHGYVDIGRNTERGEREEALASATEEVALLECSRCKSTEALKKRWFEAFDFYSEVPELARAEIVLKVIDRTFESAREAHEATGEAYTAVNLAGHVSAAVRSYEKEMRKTAARIEAAIYGDMSPKAE